VVSEDIIDSRLESSIPKHENKEAELTPDKFCTLESVESADIMDS